MATQIVPTMRMKVNPNPRGSATTHVTMPGANPYERESVSIRPANQPRDMLPGMGDFSSDFQAALTGDNAGGTATGSATAAGDGSSTWGSFFGKLTDSVLSVGTGLAKSKIEQRQMEKLQEQQKQQNLQTSLINLIAADKASKIQRPQIVAQPTTQTQPLPHGQLPTPAPRPSGMGMKTPLIIGAVAVAAVGGYMLMRKGGGRRRRRR